MTARIVSSSFRMGQGGAATASGTLQWDVGSNSGDISGLHASDKVCEKTTSGGSGYSVFVCKQRFPATGTHTIDVRVDSRSTEMAIGVVKSFSDIQSHDKSSKGWIGGGSNGWGVFNDGDGCHSGSWNSLSPGFSSGDTVKIIYNADAGTFGWAVKGTTHSAVYSGVTGPVYLAVSMGASGTCKTTIAASSFPMGTTDVAVASDAPHSGTTPEYEWLVESPMTAVNDIVECGQASGFSGYKAAVSKIAFPSTGTHYVEVNVERRDDSMAIGVVKSWDLLQTHSNGSKGYIGNGSHGWCLFSDGDGAHDGSWKGGSPGISSGTGGTKVKLVFNADRGDLGWVVGGTDRGVVYTGLPTGQGVYFAVAMGSSGGRVKILSASFPMGGAPSAAASVFTVSACGMTEFNGTYAVDTAKDGGVRNGKPCYRKNAAGSAGGKQTVNFSSGSWYMCEDHSGSWYKVSSSADLPPASGWSTGSNGTGSPPHLMFSAAGSATADSLDTWHDISARCRVPKASSNIAGSQNALATTPDYWESNGKQPSDTDPHWLEIELPSSTTLVPRYCKLETVARVYTELSYCPRTVHIRTRCQGQTDFGPRGPAMELPKDDFSRVPLFETAFPILAVTPGASIAAVTAAPLSQPAILKMPGSGSCGNRNHWFDIRSKSASDIEIVDIVGWTSNHGALVYWRPGTHNGYEHSSDGWTEIGTTPEPVLSPHIVIPAGGTIGIYLYGTDSSSIDNTDSSDSCGTVFHENSDIAVLVGKAADGGRFSPDERGDSWLQQGRGKRGLKGRVVYSAVQKLASATGPHVVPFVPGAPMIEAIRIEVVANHCDGPTISADPSDGGVDCRIGALQIFVCTRSTDVHTLEQAMAQAQAALATAQSDLAAAVKRPGIIAALSPAATEGQLLAEIEALDTPLSACRQELQTISPAATAEQIHAEMLGLPDAAQGLMLVVQLQSSLIQCMLKQKQALVDGCGQAGIAGFLQVCV
jgi:hypothetical protein